MNSSDLKDFTDTLKASAANYGVELDQRAIEGLSAYYELLSSWNARLHLVAPTSPGEFATRHILESLTLLRHFDESTAVADVGSGGGLPAVPCLIVRPDINVTLIESSQKKAIFLHEALRATNTAARAVVVNERFEDVAPPAVDYVTCRAIERFEQLIPRLVSWSPKSATLLLFGGESLRTPLENEGRRVEGILLPNSERRFLFIARNSGN